MGFHGLHRQFSMNRQQSKNVASSFPIAGTWLVPYDHLLCTSIHINEDNTSYHIKAEQIFRFWISLVILNQVQHQHHWGKNEIIRIACVFTLYYFEESQTHDIIFVSTKLQKCDLYLFARALSLIEYEARHNKTNSSEAKCFHPETSIWHMRMQIEIVKSWRDEAADKWC